HCYFHSPSAAHSNLPPFPTRRSSDLPQYVYYIIPLSGLVATLITIGLLTRNSELIIMRACGISLYRSTAPMLLFAAACSLVLFEDRKSTRLNSSHEWISYAVFCLKKK